MEWTQIALGVGVGMAGFSVVRWAFKKIALAVTIARFKTKYAVQLAQLEMKLGELIQEYAKTE